jgi:hypothetical protein
MVIAARLLLEVFHLGEQGVPPGGTLRSTWGNINHGFLHGFTMEESESTLRTSTSPLWGLVAAAQGSGGRWGSREFEERHGGLRP